MAAQQIPTFEALLESINTAMAHPNDTAWNIYRYLNAHVSDKSLSSQEARTLLASYMKLPLLRPSLLHSCFLSVALKMAQLYDDFRLPQFLMLWGYDRFLREEDRKEQTAPNGYKYSSLKERTDRALQMYLLRHPEERGTVPAHIAVPSLLVGYVEYIDEQRSFWHVYDSFSRHFVAIDPQVKPQSGDFVMFAPEFPKEGTFKKASIVSICEAKEGMETFGLRKARVTYSDREQGYCAWELLPENVPIVELGTEEPSYTKGYISLHTCQNLKKDLPNEGMEISIVVFLKRGKDRLKRPYVVYFQ